MCINFFLRNNLVSTVYTVRLLQAIIAEVGRKELQAFYYV